MSDRAAAEENLRVIRNLMERATVYRAISAPSALVAGLLSTLAAGFVYYNNEVNLLLGRTVRPREFAGLWIGVLSTSVGIKQHMDRGRYIAAERNLDENQRLIDQGRVKKGKAAPVVGIEAPTQVVPSLDFVDGLIGNDLIENRCRT